MNIGNLTFKQKEKLIKHIYNKYNIKLELLKQKQDIKPFSSSLLYVKENSSSYLEESKLIREIEIKRELENFINIINNLHKHISKDSYNIIYNEYIINNEKYWWMDFYSKSTYYRLKNKAFNEFFEYLDVDFVKGL